MKALRTSDQSALEKQLLQYNRFGRRRVQGFFNRIDAELFSCILLKQKNLGIVGSTAEIGLHHGASFVPLCMVVGGNEKAVGLDVFEDQQLNLDNSGSGSYSALLKTLNKNSISLSNVEIIKSSSLGLDPRKITDIAGPIRFFSVDGGHWRALVKNDLDIAEQCSGPGSVIALDDFYSKSWPDVTLGFFDWYMERGQFVPIALGHSKIYVCQPQYRDAYVQAIMENQFLNYHFSKMYNFLGVDVPIVLGIRSGIRTRLKSYLRAYYPGLTAALKRIRR